jgi:hypothetical protein
VTLENLLRIGKLKAHAADEREILRLLADVRAWIEARRKRG